MRAPFSMPRSRSNIRRLRRPRPRHATTADAAPGHAAVARSRIRLAARQLQSVGVFGAPGAKEHYGWVALGRRQSGSWVPHFNGYTISDTSLPPPGTVLSAQMMLPVWSEPQGATNDQTKLQSRLPNGALRARCCRRAAVPVGCGPRSLRPHAREPDRARAFRTTSTAGLRACRARPASAGASPARFRCRAGTAMAPACARGRANGAGARG